VVDGLVVLGKLVDGTLEVVDLDVVELWMDEVMEEFVVELGGPLHPTANKVTPSKIIVMYFFNFRNFIN
jgi:hypothetical protein